MIRVLCFLAASFVAFSQNASIIQSLWPPQTTLTFYDGSNNPEYYCIALSKQPNYQWTGTSLITNIVDAANTATITFPAAHGLAVDNQITISGVVSSGATGLNGTFKVVSVGSTTTLTITTSGVTDGTYTPVTDPLMQINTTAPRTTAAAWQIMKLYYTTTYNTRIAWAGGSLEPNNICDNRTTLSYN